MSSLEKLKKVQQKPALNYDKGLAAWVGYFFKTSGSELSGSEINDFLQYACSRLNEPETKQRINDKLEEIYQENSLTANLAVGGIEASVFDSDYFMQNDCIGCDRGPLKGAGEDYTPNIVLSNVRSRRVPELVSPISIFPNTSYNEGEYTKIYLLHEFQGEISEKEAYAVLDWTNNISDEMFQCVGEEYLQIVNHFLHRPVKKERTGYVIMPDDSKRRITTGGEVDEDLMKKAGLYE